VNFTLRIWKQKNAKAEGRFIEVPARGISPETSFLEMLDVVNDEVTRAGGEPVAFDHDCREGICGSCSLVINGEPHGPNEKATTCQVYMRSFHDDETITVEPFRARAFPVLKDLVTDRGAFDRIIQTGGFISVNTGQAPEANGLPIGKDMAEKAFDSAACIGCGACVAACKNSSAMLFVGAKITHLGLIPQGQPERSRRALAMVERMDSEGFGNCTNQFECQAACPKGITVANIARMNRDYLGASLKKLFAG